MFMCLLNSTFNNLLCCFIDLITMALSKEAAKYPPGIVVSAAIDLGTTFSGYAFAFK